MKKVLTGILCCLAFAIFFAPYTSISAVEFDDTSYTDFSCEFDLELSADSGAARIFFHGVDENTAYVFSVYSATDKVCLEQYENHGVKVLGTRRCPIKAGQIYKVKILSYNGKTTIYFNENPLDENPYPKFEITLTYFKSGKLGIKDIYDAKISNLKIAEYTEQTLSIGDSYTNPVCSGADPDVMYYDGVNYLYNSAGEKSMKSDGALFSVSTSVDLVNWHYEKAVFYSNENFVTKGHMSPNVFYYDGLFYLIYAAEGPDGVYHVYYASSNSPTGEFTHKNGQIPFNAGVKEIGAHPFVDDDGKVYFTLCRFSREVGEYIEIMQADVKDGVITMLTDKSAIAVEPWDYYEREDENSRVCEGGVFIKHNGLYYMIYASGHYAGRYGEAYAVSDSILGKYTKYEYNDFLTYNSTVYGTGDGIVVPSPDGSELFMVYHSHYNMEKVSNRQTCIDRIKFVKNPEGGPDILCVYGPTTTAQPLPSGATSTGFEIPSDFDGMPIVYVDFANGSDDFDGGIYTPFATLDKAYSSIAPGGGVIVLKRDYDITDANATDRAYFETPKNVTGKVMICGKTQGITLKFKYLSLNCEHYFDNITLNGATKTAVIEGRFNNLTIGKYVTTVSNSNLEDRYPFIVGGSYLFGNVNEDENAASSPWKYYTKAYKSYTDACSDKNSRVTVMGGTWRSATAGNWRHYGSADIGTISGSVTLKIGGNAIIMPRDDIGEKYFASALGMTALSKTGKATLIIDGGTFYSPVFVLGRAGYQSSTSNGKYEAEGSAEAYINGGVFNDFAPQREYKKSGGVYLSQDGIAVQSSCVYTFGKTDITLAGFSSAGRVGDTNSDGVLSLIDALNVLQKVNFNLSADGCDANLDGVVSVDDAEALVKILAAK